jgi:hypothetical protein
LFRFGNLAYAMPTLSLPDDFLPRATQLLLPRFSTPDEREAWLAQAFFLNDPRLYHDLRQLSGAPIVYVTRCITALLTAKCIPGRDIHSLALLLNAVRIDSAPAERREIDTLVDLLDPMCGPDAAPDTEPNTLLPTDTATLPAVKPANPLQSIDTPETERSPTVFISYSHRDDDFAHKLIADLQNAGHAIWIDTVSIKGGDAWVRSIADGIRNSYAFVTIISPDANGSRWVLREYLLAENLRKPIFPVVARPSDIPFQMIDRQVIELHVDYSAGLKELVESLPAPSIPVPSAQAVVDLLSEMSAPSRSSSAVQPPPPAPSVPIPQPAPVQKPVPQAPPASRSPGTSLPDLGGLLGTLKDAVLGRKRDEQSRPEPSDDAKKGEVAPPPPPRPSAPITPPSYEPPAEAEEVLDDDEAAAPGGAVEEIESQAVAAPSRRALELQYVQRQWAEAFSAQQDAPDTDDDMIVRWMSLPSDADLNADASLAESGHVESVGAGLLTMRRAVVMGDSPREASEAVWSAVNALMPGALNDPSKPLPILLDLSKWTDETQSLGAFVHDQLGDLGDYWHGLVAQQRAALLLSGVDTLPEARKVTVEAFLRDHPELPVLVAKVG